MSFRLASSQHSDGLAVLTLEQCESSEHADAALIAVWVALSLDVAVSGVAVLSDAKHLHSPKSAPSDDDYVDLGPKAHGLLKPFGVALCGECFDSALDLVADADVVVASADASLGDASAADGRVARHASHLKPLVPGGDVSRMALLGRAGAMSAARAQELGIVTEIVDRDRLRPVLESRLREYMPR